MVNLSFKKLVLIALITTVITSISGASATFAETPAQQAGFEDELFYKCVLRSIGAEEDTVLTPEQLSEITSIDCDGAPLGLNIESLADIAKMQGLKSIKLINIGHNLTQADFSTNLDLTSIVMREAFGLRSVNISQNAALEVVDFSNSGLSTVDLSHNPNLKRFGISGGHLESIDVSHNPLLTYLYALNSNSYSEFTSIDVSHNPLLEHLLIQSNKKITSVDLSNNPKLHTLYADHTSISSIDLSHNPELYNLRIYGTPLSEIDITKNNIYYLKAYNTNLTSLDLSKSPNLRELDIHDTGISNLDLSGKPRLEELITYNTNINELTITDSPNLELLKTDNIPISGLVKPNEDNGKIFNLSTLNFPYGISAGDGYTYDESLKTVTVTDEATFAGFVQTTGDYPFKMVLIRKDSPVTPVTPEEPVTNPSTLDNITIVALASVLFAAAAFIGFNRLTKRH